MSVGLKLRWLLVRGKVLAHNREGTMLFHEKKFREAEAELRTAIQIFPESAVSHCNLGMVLMAQSRLREAETEFRQAVRIDPHYPEGHAEL